MTLDDLKNVEDYVMVSARDTHYLENLVVSKLKQGYILYGPPSNTQKDTYNTQYNQAMVKLKTPEPITKQKPKTKVH